MVCVWGGSESMKVRGRHEGIDLLLRYVGTKDGIQIVSLVVSALTH